MSNKALPRNLYKADALTGVVPPLVNFSYALNNMATSGDSKPDVEALLASLSLEEKVLLHHSRSRIDSLILFTRFHFLLERTFGKHVISQTKVSRL